MLSATMLFLLMKDTSAEAMHVTNRVVGATFFAGIIALFYTARAKKERVVYLERKKDNDAMLLADQDEQGVMDEMEIKSIVQSRDNVAQKTLNTICSRLNAGQGAIYVMKEGRLELKFGYALPYESFSIGYDLGEGLVGRTAAEGNTLYLDQLPEGYITVFSGLGNSHPTRLVLVPVKDADNKTKGVIEIATFSDINKPTLKQLESSAAVIAPTIY